MIAGGLERPGEQRALGLQQELEGRRRDLVRGRAVLVGRDRDGDGRLGAAANAGTAAGWATPRRSSSRQPCGGVSVPA